jgi:DNA-binding GntR family transcriptional regulator
MTAANTIKTTGQFVEAVRMMRLWQKERAKSNSPLAQREAREHEALVDACIEERDARRAGEKQPGLFGGGA